MGRLFYNAAQDTDIPILMGILLIIATLVVVFQIITDVTYTFLDPRIRYDCGKRLWLRQKYRGKTL